LLTLPYDAPGAMDLHPNLSLQRALRAVQLVLKSGHLCEGAEAVAFTLAMRPGFGFVVVLYHLPLFRQLAQLLYFIFKNRPRTCETCA
jgi:hypothetical protein